MLAVVTMLYITSPVLIYLITGSLYPLIDISPFPPPPRSPANTIMFSVATSSVVLDSTYKRAQSACVFLCLTSLTEHNGLRVRPRGCKWQGFLLSCGWLVFDGSAGKPQAPPWAGLSPAGQERSRSAQTQCLLPSSSPDMSLFPVPGVPKKGHSGGHLPPHGPRRISWHKNLRIFS